MSDAYLLDAVRVPFGRYGGALAGVRPDDLGAHVVKQIVERSDLDPERIDDVMFGNANGAGEDNRNIARMAALLAGLPTTTPGTTINRLCGSSLDAAMQASRAVETGDADLVLVGGVESMSRAPWVVLKPEKGFPAGAQTMHSTTLGWRMVNPEMPDQWTISLGESTEKLAGIHNIGREAQDEFALKSHQRAAAAWDAGHYDGWVVAVPDTELRRDEGIRADSSLEKLAKLKPAFVKDGTVTAGNASPLNDGAAAVLIGSENAGEPMARIAGRGTFAVDPDIFGIGPVEAANRALKRAGNRLGRRRPGGAQRGVRGAIARLRGRVGHRPGEGQRRRRRDRDRPPARGVRRADPGHAGQCAQAHRRPLGRRRDLHRCRPGSGRGVGGVMFRDDSETHPPMDYPGYKSTALRHPKQPLIALPHRLTEVTAPVFGDDRIGELDHDLTRQHEGEPQGQRIIVHGHVKEDDGRPVPDTLVEVWQANAGGRYRHRWDTWDSPIDPNFSGAGRTLTDANGYFRFITIRPGAYPWGNHPNAWRPAHIHFSLFGRAFTQRLVTQMYFPDDPLFFQDPMYNSVRDERAAKRMISAFDYDATEESWALAFRWDIVLRGEETTPSEEPHA